MKELMWKVIKESKNGEHLINPERQYDNLEKILKNYDQETVRRIYQEWKKTGEELRDNKEFDKLHLESGGIVSSGDDGFYMDFLNWLIAQGEDLWKEFNEKGSQVVLDYIENNNISEEDYLYECMIYVFHPFIF